MHRYKAKINGTEYWYVSDRVYITKGKTIPTSSSLGRVDVATEETLRLREAKFQQKIASLEIRLRTKYWMDRVQNKSTYTSDVVERMETLRAQLYRAKAGLGPFGDSALEFAFLIDFIYNSNKIEGSRLPRDEVQRLIKSKSARSNNEAINTLRAKGFIDQKFQFNIAALIKVHRILLAHEPSKHGLREEEVIIGNQATLPSSQIRQELTHLFAWYRKVRFEVYPPELAFLFYLRFERIHPFVDGNGRIGRLIMNKILKDARYHPIIIWNANRIAHFSAFTHLDRDRTPFLRFMNDQFAKTYNTYLKKIEPAIDYEEKVNFFLSPSE